MRVVLTVNAAWNALNFRRAIIEALIARGDEVFVLAPPDSSVEKLVEIGCKFVPLQMDQKGISPLRDGALILRLKSHFKTLNPDVILSYTIKNNLFGAMAAKSLGMPFLPNVSGLGTAFLSGRSLQRVAQSLYKHAFRSLPFVFFQNPEDSALFTELELLQGHQVSLLPGSGIDLARFSPTALKSPQKTSFLMVSRALRDKGVVEYAQAAQILRSEGHDFEFQLLGSVDANNRSAIDAETIKNWQDKGLIKHLGETDDVRPFIAAAQCVVLPSYREGAPRTLLEASAMARPVIATDVPGCRQVVEDKTTGILCQPRNATSLADACRQFLAMTPRSRETMGVSGRSKMEAEYDQKIVVDAYIHAIDTVAQNKFGRTRAA